MAPTLISLGVIFGLIGACNLFVAAGDRNASAALGGFVIALVFLVPSVLALVYGIKRAGRPMPLRRGPREIRGLGRPFGIGRKHTLR